MFLVTTSDITHRLETEQQLIQASKMATLGEMATGVAHELNQPLSVIKTASTFLIKKIDRKEQVQDNILFTLCEEIDSHVDRATKIITHMRQFGRMSDMKLEKVQINDILKSAYQFFSQQLKVRGITVGWHIQEHLPEIIGNPDRLEQVFINLLINARDAIEEKYTGMEYRPDDKVISIKSYAENHQVLVEVSDTGAGIPKKITDKIFEPFFTTKDVGKGTGLGLSISYGILKEIGGDIQVVPGPTQGARFILSFPIPQANDSDQTAAG
ncbi:Sensory box histidine kinase [Olavius algarvensis associated proteobacterium Delta 3]|nr:Sensory box histidine kinase [Olavius algarvensis associated proteobacterium Delta 3]CAB5163793.1 Sensory box histidine kinase [Olavius algarvensis associated proteobacterium Delta 3]